IEPPEGEEVARLAGSRTLEQRAVAHVLAGGGAAAGGPRQNDAVQRDQLNQSAFAVLDEVVELGEVLGIDAGDDDATEAAVGAVDAPADLDCGPSGDAPRPWRR